MRAYDGNGNTTQSIGLGYSYDFENHLVQQAGIAVVYDGDGNRVAKTTANGTTKFLVDDLNPTGYAQVMDELQSSAVARTYTWGLELISEHQSVNSTPTTSYYVFDGHGSVRALTNTSGAITDTYDYDAFGNLLHSTFTSVPPLGSTVAPSPNNYLYSGEQFDPDLHLYYNRARYLNTSTGRFWSMDSFEGSPDEPLSLHKYLYGNGDPSNSVDPSGHDVVDLVVAVALTFTLASIAGDNAPVIIQNIKQDPLKKDFATQFTAAAIRHAKDVGAFPIGTLSNLADSICRFRSAVFSPRKCELGCLAWQNWMVYEWFPAARAKNAPTWDSISISQVYSLEFPLFIHNYARARFPIAPLILDPWRDYEHPVWAESDYVRIQGVQINDGSYSLN